MADGNATITIARPLDDVWAVLTDPEKSPIWSAPTIEEHWLTPPPHGLGSRRRAVNRGFGRTQTNDAEVTAYDPKRSWTMTSVVRPAICDDRRRSNRSKAAPVSTSAFR